LGLDAKPAERELDTRRHIPVAGASLVGNEKAYVMDCLQSTWISSTGKYVEQFEAAFKDFCHVRHAISCCNGTAALHLALMALGVRPGDEVIVPTLTFVATANAVTYCRGRPVFVDSEPETWNMDPGLIEAAVTPRTKGIIVVHLYGHPADMDRILSVAQRHGLFVLEDAAESHGAEYNGRKVGSIGDVATFSFYGNKTLTTGEGGMVVTNDDAVANRVRQLRGQGMDSNRRYWFPVIGYNYRMTNIAAAIGLAQLEKAEWHLQRRLEVARWYREQLRGGGSEIAWQSEQEWARHVYWMFTILLGDNIQFSRDEVMAHLQEHGIETRPVFYPIHTLPPYLDLCQRGSFPVADRIARRGISLPTWAGLNREDVHYVCDTLLEYLKEERP
jgi:perosamine synthetase